MMSLASEALCALKGRTLATAESCTGGMIGSALTAVPGSSQVYKGGIISYWNETKEQLLGVAAQVLETVGPVSATVAMAMAQGAAKALNTDIAVSVTGLAGPGGDAFGNPVGTVFIGYWDACTETAEEFHFSGSRQEVRRQAAQKALEMILKYCKKPT